jgi:hypothetical protein
LNLTLLKSTKGAIGLLTTLILTVALVAMAIGITLNGISTRANTLNLNQSEKVFIPVEGCLEEALLRLNRNNDYAGGSYNIGNVDCTVLVSGSGDTRNIVVNGEKNNITRDLLIRAQINPSFAIMQWGD